MNYCVTLNAKETDRSIVLRKFNYLTSISEKVKYAGSKVHEISNTNRSEYPFFDSVKNDKTSRQARNLGNRYRNESRFGESLLAYNSSICYAQPNSGQLGLGYACRSEVYLELKMYRLCLANINLARDSNYPLKLMDKLNATESACLIQMNEMNDAEIACRESPELSIPAHPNVPFIANCLELHENNRFGRHITTNVDLAVGQLVAIEESYTAILNESLKYQRCTNCLLENEFSLIPCESCVFTMFCSQKCLTEAERSYHRIECPIIQFLGDRWNDIIYITIRTCIRAITSFSQLDELQKFLKEAKTDRINAFTLNYCDNMPSSELYKAIHTLQTNQDKRSTQELFDIAAVTSYFCDILLENTPLSETINSEKKENMFMELIFTQLQIASVNKNCLENKNYALFNSEATWNPLFNEAKWKPIFNELFKQNPKHSPDVYGNATFAFSGLINHSCIPNVIRIFYGRKSATFAIRPIKAGEQLFLKYDGIGPLTHKLNDRQEKISSKFFFKCECKACQNEYPVLQDFKCNPRIKNDFDPSDILHSTDADFAKRFVADMGPVLSNYDDDDVATRLEVIVYQELFHLCLNTIYNYPPFRLRGNEAFEAKKSLERQKLLEDEIQIRDQKILDASESSEISEDCTSCFGWIRKKFSK